MTHLCFKIKPVLKPLRCFKIAHRFKITHGVSRPDDFKAAHAVSKPALFCHILASVEIPQRVTLFVYEGIVLKEIDASESF